MSDSAAFLVAQEWRKVFLGYSESVRVTVKKIALENKSKLVSFFYEKMLQDPAAKLFLSHEKVKSQLSTALQNWITQLFSAEKTTDFVDLVELQRKVGEAHARIDLPLHLVLNGTRHLKSKFSDLLTEVDLLSEESKKQGFEFVSGSLDMAMELMSRSYASAHDRKNRADDSYRLFSAIHNSAAEKEQLRSALLEWENSLIFDLIIKTDSCHLSSISKSDFGLWFIHKGSHIFDGFLEVEQISRSIDRIDKYIVNLSNIENEIELLKNIRLERRNIQNNLVFLFDKHNELEAGRDELTRLLSRKYLSVILSKEANYARKRNINFALIAIDLDYFKQVNDSYGHEAGDMILQQFAELLSSRSRAGDYVFRVGGEEFLILLVDIDRDSSIRVAKQVSQRISEEKFSIPNGELLSITASLGVTLFDGHPDYRRSLNRVDQALYQAKSSGRNQVVYIEP